MRALILIQGINKKGNYLLDGIGHIASHYDKIFYAKTERTFDVIKDSLPFYLQWIPDKYKELLADLIGFFKNKYTRKSINFHISDKIDEFKALGYEVDILSHSLGTLIALALGSKKKKVTVNTLFMLNSPLGIDSKILRLYVKANMLRFSKYFYCRDLQNVWSDNDFVSKDMAKSLKFVEKRADQSTHYSVKNGGHDHKNSIKKIKFD